MNSTICAECGYPIPSHYTGEIVTCPMCQTVNEITQGVTIPTPLFAGGLGFLFGIMIGPALIASSDWGRRWLQKKASGG